MIYCNDMDAGACAWMRELMAAGVVPEGVVDERSIKDVAATDLVGYRRCHFFAGILGWELALRQAGWPAEQPVWTGSCPCQPYSAAGKRKGNADDRDLWPDFFRLIRECRPECVVGEQVEGAIKHGWLDRVCADLEGEGYAVGSCVLGAHSVGAPHIRQRLYWIAHRLGNADCERPSQHALLRRQEPGRVKGDLSEATGDGVARGLGNSGGAGWEGEAGSGVQRGFAGENFWAGSVFIPCRDGKARRVPTQTQSGLQPVVDGISAGVDGVRVACPDRFPLAEGVKNRTMLLRGAGNAICVPTAAVFIRAFLEATGDLF